MSEQFAWSIEVKCLFKAISEKAFDRMLLNQIIFKATMSLTIKKKKPEIIS